MMSRRSRAVRGSVTAHGRPVMLWMPVIRVWVPVKQESRNGRGGDAWNLRRGTNALRFSEWA